ncbi:LysR family transcriptional regulator [Kordiimonas marina]|uniref:LysR family transcriptional regulator n=1 Tax=Kordiimonas marina TaxID=2872312 RepID=UPI001FF0E6D7|nr:LysR family transcriptional regulator [Kordiimonas marina]MCJ9427767.1 LysR family transcriptional regulator [Kordiimonas marina]
MPNIRHLRAFVAIARHESVSRAAQAVNLTQPAVTQGIAKLERQLDTALFSRRADGMDTTEAARVILPRVETVLELIGSSRVTSAQMRALVVLARTGGYAAASQRSGLAEASLHRAIADLSLALSEKLVERRGRGIMLTDRGLAKARAYRLAYAEMASALSELDALKGRETGRIAIGAMPLCRARLLPTALAAFHAQYPNVDIVIAEGSYSELIGPLRDGELDLTIGALRDPATLRDLKQESLFIDRPVIFGRANHPLLDGNPTISELKNFPWIVPAPGVPLRMHWEEMFAQAGLTPPHVPIECGSVITIRQLLLTGDFLTILSPDQVAVELEAGLLAKVCDPPEPISRTIGVVTRAAWTPTPSQHAFLDILHQSADKNS